MGAKNDNSRLALRIFLSSPGDVCDERALARTVLERLSQEYALRRRIHIEEVSWDDPGAPVPMDAHLTPQEAIGKRRPKPSQCDIVVVVLWSRMGTPLPPEHRKPDGRPYVSGTEYEFCDAMDAAKRAGKPTTLVYRRTEEPKIGLGDRDLDEKHRQYRGVDTFFAQFTSADGSLRQSYTPYGSPSEFSDKLERALRELIQVQLEALPKGLPAPLKDDASAAAIARDTTTKPAWEGNPYRGLNAFRERHAAIFFGRGRETDELVKRLAIPTTRMVAVIGASGSGKSSLVGAGLIPRLHAGAFPGSAGWVTVRFTPAERGSDPFLNLMRRLAPTLASPSTPLETLADTLRTHPIEINALAAQVLQGESANAELLLFADQFEEIFSARVEEQHRGPFISLMDEIARSQRIRLVLTLRADYYEHCTRDPRLAAWLREGSFPLAAPTPLALAEMIERPARVAGLDPEPGLADAILQDAGTEPGALALVEFALEELYERSGGKRLTLAAYRALGGKGGGIGGVIEGQAEKAVQDAAGKVDGAALAKIFPLLADVDEQGGAVRKRARRDSFAEREEALIDRLVDGRLLVSNRDDAKLSWVEVAHEAVLRHWPRLSNWLTDNRDFLLWRRRLKVWMESGSLLHGALLTVAKDWRKRRGRHALTPEENAFVSRSFQRQWLMRLGAGAVTAFVVFVVGLLLWTQQAQLTPKLAGLLALSYLGYTPAPEMVTIPKGRFSMGSPESEPDRYRNEGPQHEVVVATNFAIGKYEVTFDEYDLFLKSVERDGGCQAGHQPERLGDEGRGRRRPAINVSWHDANCYAEWLTKKRGLDDKHRYRLPTEAEWEYAARAGTKTRYWWGDEVGKNNANCAECGSQWDGKQTAPVGSFQPNGFVLQDILGNVWEWVEDCWIDNYYWAPAWAKQQGDDCAQRVIRGGSWSKAPRDVRSATRNGYSPGYRSDDVGFRLAQDN